MPNPDPTPGQLRVIIRDKTTGLYYDVASYIPKDWKPSIKLTTNGLSTQSTLPLRVETGYLPFTLQEWADLIIDTPASVSPYATYFRGYVSSIRTKRKGPQKHYTLTLIDGNEKLKRGIDADYDAQIGYPGMDFSAGTPDNEVIADLFSFYLPSIHTSGAVAHLFDLPSDITFQKCNLYTALKQLQKLAPSGVRPRFYVTFDPSDIATHRWILRWYDVNSISTNSTILVDDPQPGAGKANYYTFERVRDGKPIYNQWTVISKANGLQGIYRDTASVTALGVVLGGQSEVDDAYTVAELEDLAEKAIRNKSRARETFPGLTTHLPVSVTAPELIRIKNDLEPGITTATAFPVASATLTYGDGNSPIYIVDLGDMMLAGGEEDDSDLVSTPPTADHTAPAQPSFDSPAYTQAYQYVSNQVLVTAHWLANTEGDLKQYHLYYRRYDGDDLAHPFPWVDNIVLAPNLSFNLPPLPPGCLLGLGLAAEDYSGNISPFRMGPEFFVYQDSPAAPTITGITTEELPTPLVGTVKVAWTVPGPAHSASVIIRATATGQPTIYTPSILTTTGYAIIPGVRRGVAYSYTAQSINQWGTYGAFGSPTIYTVAAYVVPVAPAFTIPASYPINTVYGALVVAWSAPAANVVALNFRAVPQIAGYDTVWLTNVSSLILATIFAGLALGVPYDVSLQGVDNYGANGAWGSPTAYTIQAPTDLTIINGSFEVEGVKGQVAAGWDSTLTGLSTTARSQAGGATDGLWALQSVVAASGSVKTVSAPIGTAAEGSEYRFAFTYKTSTAFHIALDAFDKDGGFIDVVQVFTPDAATYDGTWRKYEANLALTGGVASATNVKVRIYSSTAGTFYVDSLSLTRLINNFDLGKQIKGDRSATPVDEGILWDELAHKWVWYSEADGRYYDARNIVTNLNDTDRTVNPEPTSPTQISGTSVIINLAHTAKVRIHARVWAEKSPASSGSSRISIRDGSTIIAPTNTSNSQAYYGVRSVDNLIYWDITTTRELAAGSHTLSLYADAVYTTASITYHETEIEAEEIYE